MPPGAARIARQALALLRQAEAMIRALYGRELSLLVAPVQQALGEALLAGGARSAAHLSLRSA